MSKPKLQKSSPQYSCVDGTSTTLVRLQLKNFEKQILLSSQFNNGMDEASKSILQLSNAWRASGKSIMNKP